MAIPLFFVKMDGVKSPGQVYAEYGVADSPLWHSIIERYPKIKWIEDYRKFRLESVVREKECLIFARKRGAWLKPFHCYHGNSEFEYYSLDVAEGCYFDCVYCYLQTYLNHEALVVFVDVENVQPELNRFAGRRLWISTGLLSDSFLAESEFPVLPFLSKQIPENSLLELRTKSTYTLLLENGGIEKERVVVSWSLNPQTIAQNYEYRTPSLSERLNAIERAIGLGYRVGIHLDPVFHFPRWREEYEVLWQKLSALPAERVAFLSLGLFRYMPDLGSVIRKRFPFHPIMTGEFFPDEDGKYHYFRSIRKEMYKAFLEWLRPWKGTVPILWSMEPMKIHEAADISSADVPSAR